jgi:hypothetical protein
MTLRLFHHALPHRVAHQIQRTPAILRLLLLAILLLVGCKGPMPTPTRHLLAGDYASARTALHQHMTTDRNSRSYLLDRMRVAILTVADGYPSSAQTVFEEVYDILRTQGINRDKTVASVVLNEDLKIWKGEPFEQALALAYFGIVQAELDSWDNARAAANASLFHLRDFGSDDQGDRLDTYQIARRSLLYERAVAEGASPEQAREQADYLDHGYVPRESSFTLGYLLAALANQQLGRDDEASDHYTRLAELDPQLDPLIEAFRSRQYNTILLVSFGLGPEKQGYGPDRALARFSPRFPSSSDALFVRVADAQGQRYPQLLDVNAMAGDHMWNNLEDIRAAKSTLGSVLLVGGLISTQAGLSSDTPEAVYAGLGAAAAGLFLKAGAHVDTRYCDVMPQRIYAVPLLLADQPEPITLQLDRAPASRIVLTGLAAPTNSPLQLRYVRLNSDPAPDRPSPPWATSGQVLYDNPYTGPVTPNPLPYILGGRCVRPPTHQTLDDYQRDQNLLNITLAELRRLYDAEGIACTIEDQQGYADAHLLEGGHSLVCPLPGTTGFTRLFGQKHPPYQPRTDEVTSFAQQHRAHKTSDQLTKHPSEPNSGDEP